MGRRLRIGRVFGVEVAVDWSCVFTFVLATWTLVAVGERLLPSLHMGLLALLGAAAASGLFASLVLHEVSHGLAARACGVPVTRLTLFLFGGITDVERAPASPRSEVIAAIVAPLTNALLGATLLGLAALLDGPIALLVTWLGGANLAIAALNLLPAFPLDGGRLVRAAMWRATGDVTLATRWAAWGGQTIGWSLVLGGVALSFAAHGLEVAAVAIWTAVSGWFLASAAAQAYEGVLAQEALAGLPVSRLMRRRVRAVPVDVTSDELVLRSREDLATAYRTMVDRDVDMLPVVDHGRLVGLAERADIEQWIETFAVSPAPMSLKEHG